MNTTRLKIAEEDVPKPTHETREYFVFPELHPKVEDAVCPNISSTWFNADVYDDVFDHERFTHVMGREN
jgi:hypothetical protein